tara:strand:- start:507 stop:1133 length:627 start_codon:yes stop_codon:yes gene_type:complete
MIKKELLQLFAIPLLITKYENNLSKELAFVEKFKYDPNGMNGNFRSKDSYVFDKKQLSNIKKFCQHSLDIFTKEIMQAKEQLIITQSWCNTNPKGSVHHEHIHPNSIVSGVFYFRIDKHLPPIMFSKTQFEILKLNFEKFNSVNSETFYLPVVSGELILFPSHLRHSVPRNTSDEVRISLSFNTFAKESLGSRDSLTELNLRRIYESK